MGGLILLLILVPTVLLILQISLLSRSSEQRRLLETLYDNIKDLNSEISRLAKQGKEPVIAVQPVFKESTPLTIVPEKREVIKETPVVPPPEPVTKQEPVKTPEPEIITASPVSTTPAKKESLPVLPLKVDDDMEKFIGENVASKIGIAVLVLGISFFVKYAIDKNWVHESGRVIIGLVSGCILLGIAHRYRNMYRSFSSVLMGGGLTVFYFSIAFAFHQYHLIGQTAAFILMVAVTALAVFLSLFYNRQELAILATIGGFITPFLVSTGQDNYIALFTYLCILNGGMTALSWFKKWPAINTISLFFTTIIFGGWLINRMFVDDTVFFPAQHAFGFAVLFYLLFIAMNIINTLRVKGRFTSFDFMILLSVNFLFYLAGISILDHFGNPDLKGVFTSGLGIFNLLLTAVFYGKKNADRNFVALLTGLTLTFISLTGPVWLRGNHITLFWAAETVILLYLWQRTKYTLIKYASLAVLVLAIFSLVVNWVKIYVIPVNIIPVIFNKGFITGLAVSLALFIYHQLLRKEKEELFVSDYPVSFFRKTIHVTFLVALFFTGLLEIYYQFVNRIPEVPVHTQFTQLYTFLFATVLLRSAGKQSYFPVLKTSLTVCCLTIFLFNIRVTQIVSESLLAGKAAGVLFGAHWISSIILLWLLVDFARYLFKNRPESSEVFTWITCAAIVTLLSIEMYNLMLWSGQTSGSDRAWWENLYYKAGLSILWGVCSFILMWLGLRSEFRVWRIISLSLFTITVAKLFLYDIRNIPPGGKIAAFILLGCLLLAVSFMYQRLKRLLLDNAAGDKQETDDRLQRNSED
ncbi:MAG: DUF2339 domain-containing protein [Chitinophagaceae bacterium]